MLGTRHEEYKISNTSLPFVLHPNITRDTFNYSKEKNWHEDLEIQLCKSGRGSVLLNGEKHPFLPLDIAIVESNVIHYTNPENSLVYTCIIINPDFCRKIGINLSKLSFPPIIKDSYIAELIDKLTDIYTTSASKFKNAILNKLLLEILIELAENHSSYKSNSLQNDKHFSDIKRIMDYIRKNYNNKITLDTLAKEIFTDKYALCRNFKRYTGKTVTQYVNQYRCQMAAELISQGVNISEAANTCGFQNLSFFTKTFKKYIGMLPSEHKNCQ